MDSCGWHRPCWHVRWCGPSDTPRFTLCGCPEQDVFRLQDRDSAEPLHQRWKNAWAASNGSSWTALKLCFKTPFLRAGMYKLVNSTMQVRAATERPGDALNTV